MAANLPAPIPPDIVSSAAGFMAAVVFFQSKGRGSRLAVSYARGASDFRAFLIDGKNQGYFAGFAATRTDAERLLALMPLATRWTGTQLFLGGRPTRWTYLTERVMDCYVRGFSHDDADSYCGTVKSLGLPSTAMTIRIQLPGDLPGSAPVTPRQVVLPCRHVFPGPLTEHASAPTVRAQVHAAAIANDCTACPRYSIDRFRVLEPD